MYRTALTSCAAALLLATTAMAAYMASVGNDPRRAEVSFVQIVGVSARVERHRLDGREEWVEFFVAAMAEFADREIALLCNNAGIATTPALTHPPATTDPLAWQRSWEDYLRINTLGTAMVTHAMTRRLVELGLPGHVITIGTRGVHRGEPDYPAYAASKAALHSMDASLAVALAPHGIAVATVAPGFVETERVADRLDSPAGEAIRADSPFGRVGRPEEVASAVVWLASPDAQWASGATLDLNGASHLRP